MAVTVQADARQGDDFKWALQGRLFDLGPEFIESARIQDLNSGASLDLTIASEVDRLSRELMLRFGAEDDPDVVEAIRDELTDLVQDAFTARRLNQETVLKNSRFKSLLIAMCGISTGDEGKGRTVLDVIREIRELLRDKDAVAMVIKINGGPNSGHTAAGLKLNLLPAGVGDPDIPFLAIGRGVVADPRKILWEAAPLETTPEAVAHHFEGKEEIPAEWSKQYDVLGRLRIDNRTQVADITHRLRDLARECYLEKSGGEKRGSTGKGISPAFMDETGQQQIVYEDFLGSKEAFRAKMAEKIERTCRSIKHELMLTDNEWHGLFETLTTAEKRGNADSINFGVVPEAEFDFSQFKASRWWSLRKGTKPFSLDVDAVVDAYWEAGQKLRDNIVPVDQLILKLLDEGKFVIGEFGQAYGLDKRHGRPPNVTASHTYGPEYHQSANIPLAYGIHIMGVAKAYDTKVGTHVFLTQIPPDHPLWSVLSKVEFGTTTGRQRMVGWCDAVEKGHVLAHGGFDNYVINKLDVLTHKGDWQGDLRICYAYRTPEGEIIRHVPTSEAEYRKLTPVYMDLPGWSEDISKVGSFLELPRNAQRYIAAMYRATVEAAYHGREIPDELPPIRFIGVGPDPSQIISDAPPPWQLMKAGDIFGIAKL
ncbi:adenylosuccinate synthetase [Oligoflexia bacterium]|nr:adenylosuccinate synthetase [Oligoflexia bacterium]